MTATNLQLQALTELKGPAPKKPPKEAWAPLALDGLAPGQYLACDQSLAAAGIVALQVRENGSVSVRGAALLSTEPTDTPGWEDVLTRTEQIQRMMSDAMFRMDAPRQFAVHEAPPIGGGKFTQPEISLISAYAFRQAWKEQPSRNPGQGYVTEVMLPMVRRQDHARLVCGNSNAKKPVEHTALKALFPQIQGSEKITNEGLRDALCVGLTAAYRRAQA